MDSSLLLMGSRSRDTDNNLRMVNRNQTMHNPTNRWASSRNSSPRRHSDNNLDMVLLRPKE